MKTTPTQMSPEPATVGPAAIRGNNAIASYGAHQNIEIVHKTITIQYNEQHARQR
jgi:hypothetical protein